MTNDPAFQRIDLDPDAARSLTEHSVIRELDRSGQPHFLVKVPDAEKAVSAEVGIEIDRESDGCVMLSILVYDIPTEPVSYDVRCYPDVGEDLVFLRRFLAKAQFRLHLCQPDGDAWLVAPAQTFRLPPNVMLRLKHYSLEWPAEPPASLVPVEDDPGPDAPSADTTAIPRSTTDPRDTVIRKLKEQVEALRVQLQEKDKRIIDLEDEIHEMKSRGRPYRLSGDKKPWWKPF